MVNNAYNNQSITKYLQIILFSAVILYFGRSLFVPVSYSLFIALVLYPVCKWLEQHRSNPRKQ